VAVKSKVSGEEEEKKQLEKAFEQSQIDSTPKQNSEVLINFSAFDQYIYQVVQNMVDDVCLFNERVE